VKNPVIIENHLVHMVFPMFPDGVRPLRQTLEKKQKGSVASGAVIFAATFALQRRESGSRP
jgi:hypothetical protein